MTNLPTDAELFLDRLDRPYVRATAAAVVAAVKDGRPIEAAFQPGDGTRYDLVFVPIPGLLAAPPRSPRPGEVWADRVSFGCSRLTGAMLIVWLEHGDLALDVSLGGGFLADYVAGRFGTTYASGAALAYLIDEIAAAW